MLAGLRIGEHLAVAERQRADDGAREAGGSTRRLLSQVAQRINSGYGGGAVVVDPEDVKAGLLRTQDGHALVVPERRRGGDLARDQVSDRVEAGS